MNKQQIITSIGIASLITSMSISSTALAGHKSFQNPNNRVDHAKVITVDPIVRYVQVSTPEQHCWKEPVTYAQHHDNGATGRAILGGIIGAAIGNNLGHGSGRKQRAVAGAIIGSAVASHHGARGSYQTEHVRYESRCDVKHVSHTEERIDGYNVTYKYRGQVYHTRMPYDPGKRIRVRVNVQPIFD